LGVFGKAKAVTGSSTEPQNAAWGILSPSRRAEMGHDEIVAELIRNDGFEPNPEDRRFQGMTTLGAFTPRQGRLRHPQYWVYALTG
jgi:hypothetical protein